MEFKSSDVQLWKESLSSYKFRIESLKKPNLVSLDHFYTTELPPLIHQRNPNPHITTSELSKLMQWKLTRGKWRPRLLDFVSSLDEALVKSASQKAFQSLPDISKAVSELTVLKGVGPATASAVLASYAPDVAPFMSDEAMVAALGNSKDYTLKQYILFVDKLQAKAKDMFVVHNSLPNSMPQRYPAEPTFQSLLQGSYPYDIGFPYSQQSNSPMWSQAIDKHKDKQPEDENGMESEVIPHAGWMHKF